MSARSLELLELELVHAPGFSEAFKVQTEGASHVVIVGPNESGKSSLAAALFSVLWPAQESNPNLEITARFRLGERTLRARHRSGQTSWSDDGLVVQAPPLPADEIARCFRISVDERRGEGADTATLAAVIVRALAGGYDFAKARESLGVPARLGEAERKALNQAREALNAIASDQERWKHEADKLELLREQLGEAKLLASELPMLDALGRERSARRELQRIEPRLQEVAGSARVSERELERLAAEEKRLEQRRETLRKRETACEHSKRQLEAQAGPARRVDSSQIGARLADARELLVRESDQMRLRAELQVAQTRHARWLENSSDRECVLPSPAELERFAQFSDDWNAALAQALALADVRALLSGSVPARTAEFDPQSSAAARLRTTLLVVCAVTLVSAIAAAAHFHPLFYGLAALAAVALWIGLSDSKPLPLPTPPDSAAPTRALVEGRARTLEERQAVLAKRAQEFKSRFGLQPGLPTAVQVESLRQRANDLGLLEAARAKLAAAESAFDELRDLLTAFLSSQAVEPAGTAHGLIAQLEGLLEGQSRRAKLEEDLQRLGGEISAAKNDVLDSEAALAKLYIDAGLRAGERAALEQLVRDRAPFLKLADEAKVQQHALASALHELTDWQGWRPASDQELAQRRAKAVEMSALADKRHGEIGGIERGIAERRDRDDVENARANFHAAEAALGQRREQVLDAALAQLFVAEVERAMEISVQDPVLIRAQRMFEEFTAHRHTLQLATGGANGPDFQSHDHVLGRAVSLENLSSGTRTQLLLAARLAFAVDAAERAGVRPPLVLDEALATTDETRFEAVAGVIELLVKEGWQVIYLTSQRTDVERWQKRALGTHAAAPRVIDLGQVRQLAGAAASVQDLALPAEPALPSPLAMSADEYGLALRVPPLDLEHGIGELHMFHLLRDQLGVLHALVVLRATQLGCVERWVGKAGGAISGLSPSQLKDIEQRIALMRVFHGLWLVGRGQRVDPTALAEAQVTDNFREKLADLAKREAGDARRLIQALRQGGLSGFGKGKTDALELRFEELRCLDRRPMLELDEIILGCARELPSLGADQVGKLCSQWWSAADRSWANRRSGTGPEITTIPTPKPATQR